jgi:hypothetical protein
MIGSGGCLMPFSIATSDRDCRSGFRREIMSKSVLTILCLMQLVITLLAVSCRTSYVSRANEDGNIQRSNSNQTPTSISEKPLTGIRQINFKNFTYPWYPSYLKAPSRSREVTLQDGKFEVGEDAKKGIRYLILELDDVSYADLLGDGKEEAIVYLRGISVMNRFVGCIFVYTTDGSAPKLLWQYETGDRADGGLQKMGIENQSLVIEQYTLNGASGLCCPKSFVRQSFKWDGKQFRAVTSMTLPVDEKTRQ